MSSSGRRKGNAGVEGTALWVPSMWPVASVVTGPVQEENNSTNSAEIMSEGSLGVTGVIMQLSFGTSKIVSKIQDLKKIQSGTGNHFDIIGTDTTRQNYRALNCCTSTVPEARQHCTWNRAYGLSSIQPQGSTMDQDMFWNILTQTNITISIDKCKTYNLFLLLKYIEKFLYLWLCGSLAFCVILQHRDI